MESFDMFLNGNFVSQTAFQRRYGVFIEGSDPPLYAIETKWQSALFQSGQCGAFVGVFLAGPITNRFGYRWTTIFALILMNATIFISFFVSIPTPDFWEDRKLKIHRRTPLRFLPLDRRSREFLGDSLLRTPRLTHLK
jgi:MFS family permease